MATNISKELNCTKHKKLFIQNSIVFTIIVILVSIIYIKSQNYTQNYYQAIDDFNSGKKILCANKFLISKKLGWNLAQKSNHITNGSKLIDFLQCEPYGD